MSPQPENTLICPRCNKPVPEGWAPCEGSCHFEETDYSDFEEVAAPDFEWPCDCVREMI